MTELPKNDNDNLHGAAKLLTDYEKHPAKADEFLEAQYTLSPIYRENRRFCQFIFFAYLRNKLAIDMLLGRFLKKRPRPDLWAMLRLAASEIAVTQEDKWPKVVNSWVGGARSSLSRPEAGLMNAVLRKFADEFKVLKHSAASLEDFALLYSHPLWLAQRWVSNYGKERAIEIMRENSTQAEIYIRVPDEAACLPDTLEKLQNTDFKQFKKLLPGARLNEIIPALEGNTIYIQDPATIHAPNLLKPLPGEQILDLCAAPGGKSRIIIDMLKAQPSAPGTILVSLDRNGPRMSKLHENLKGAADFSKVIAADSLDENLPQILHEAGLPRTYDAILLDAPCSNTGVIRRRPDVRYRLSESDISQCAKIQSAMIKNALQLLKPGGRLVYSTCSIEPEENIGAPQSALDSRANIAHQETFLPGAHDGAGVALIKKI